MSQPPGNLTTKERIFEVAERLFGEKGLAGTSMRDITTAAGVNLASVNYHFGSKDGLIAAVFDHYLTPVNEARLAMLGTVEAAAGDRPPALEAVLEAFIRPAVVRALQTNQSNDSFLRLMGRCLNEPPAYAEKYIYSHFDTLVERFTAAAARAIPGMPEEEAFWYMGFVAGALHYALHIQGTDNIPFKPAKPLDAEGLVRRLISFAAAGLRTCPAQKGSPERSFDSIA